MAEVEGLRYKDITGQKFGRLTAIELEPLRTPSGNAVWKCLCDCGNEKSVAAGHLKSGGVKSCGCLRKETAVENGFKQYRTEEEKHKVVLICAARRRSRKKSLINDLSKEDIEFLELLQGNKCVSCGKDITSNYHIDHMIPLSQGGGLTLTNVQLLCPHCNIIKNAKAIDYLGYYLRTGEFLNA